MDDDLDLAVLGEMPERAEVRPAKRAPAHRFKLTPFDKVVLLKAPPYLIKGIIPAGGLTVFWGPPKCGKSFLVSYMALCVALGWPYRGRNVVQGAVVYLALEGGRGFGARLEAFRQNCLAEGTTGVPFYLVDARLNLVADARALIESIRAQVGAVAPVLVVIDTLNRSLVGSESDDKDMGAFVKAADIVREAFACAVVIVHHCGINGDRPRGHTSLTGATDAQISVKKDTASNIVATVEFMKDGPEGESFTSRLRQVEVGNDDDGELITSCIIEPVDDAPRYADNAAARLPRAAQLALRALHEAIAEHAFTPAPSTHIPTGVHAVMVEQWRDIAYRSGISDKPTADARRMAFKRAYDALLLARRIAVWDEHVWLPSAQPNMSEHTNTL